MKVAAFFVTFVVGLGVGIAVPLLGPKYADPYLPQIMKGQNEAVEGTVLAKQREAERLLLTVSTPKGALLATFKEKIAEIDLLIEQGDRVRLGVVRYEPFVSDPVVLQVGKKKRELSGAQDNLGSSSAPFEQEPPTSSQEELQGESPPLSDSSSTSPE